MGRLRGKRQNQSNEWAIEKLDYTLLIATLYRSRLWKSKPSILKRRWDMLCVNCTNSVLRVGDIEWGIIDDKKLHWGI